MITTMPLAITLDCLDMQLWHTADDSAHAGKLQHQIIAPKPGACCHTVCVVINRYCNVAVSSQHGEDEAAKQEVIGDAISAAPVSIGNTTGVHHKPST